MNLLKPRTQLFLCLLLNAAGGLALAATSPPPLASHGVLVVAPPSVSAENQNGNAVEVLFERAKRFANRGRGDLAQEVLNKLFSITTNYPPALTLQAQIYLQQSQPDKAQAMLNRLKNGATNNADVRRVESLIHSEGRDKSSLQQARNLVKEARVLQEKAGQLREQNRYPEASALVEQKNARYQQAIAIFDKLFPDGIPDDALALEYWDMVANTPNGWQTARDGLAQMFNTDPNNVRVHLALVDHELSRPPLQRKNLQFVIECTHLPEHSKLARNIWRRAMMRLDDQPVSLPTLHEYLAAEPEDSGVRAKVRAIQQAEVRHQQLLADPTYQVQSHGLELLDKGDLDAAEPLLLQAMDSRPQDSEAIGGVGLLKLKQGHHAEAKTYFQRAYQLSSDNKKKWADLSNIADFWGLLREARDARQTGDFDVAKNKVHAALKIKHNEPNAIAALGDIEADNGSSETATTYYRRALSVDPLNSSALEGLITIYRRQGMTQAQRFATTLTPAQRDVLGRTLRNMELANLKAQSNDPDELLAALDHIPSERRTDEIWRTWGNYVAQLATTQGRKEDAERLLTEAGNLAENNEDAALAIALAWAKLGNYAQTDKIFAQTQAANSPVSTRWKLAHADYLALKHAPELLAELETLRRQSDTLLPEEQLRLHDLTQQFYLDTATNYLNNKNFAEAHQTLDTPLIETPYSVPILGLKARIFQAEKLFNEASTLFTAVLGFDPYYPEGRQGLIESLFNGGHQDIALAQLNHWTEHSETESLSNQQQLVDLYLLIDEEEQARTLVQAILAKHPTDYYVLNQAMRVAQQQHQHDDQINYLRQSISMARGEIPTNQDEEDEATTDAAGNSMLGYNRLGSAKKINRDWQEKKLAALLDQRTQWFSSAVDMRGISGSAGVSRFSSIEIPLEYKRPWHPYDEVFFRADVVKLDSGTITPAATGFGGMALCQPNCNTATLNQATQGVGFTAGYMNEDFHADIGVTPPSFPVSNIVGGIRDKFNWEPVSVSWELARRPVIGSILSFAGAYDPNSGAAWGGVVSTGGRLGLNFGDNVRYNLTSTFDVLKVTGQNVISNDRNRWMNFGSWYFINEENKRFALGFSTMWWRDSHNAGEYTFGNGGYFSPANYRSLGLNLNYAERFPRWSYQVRAGVSTSASVIDSAAYFPTRPDWQLQSGLTFAGSTSTGVGFSGQSSFEYQLEQPLFLGGLFAIDRSNNYTPNRFLVYLRFALDHPAAQPVNFPPLPVEPSSQL